MKKITELSSLKLHLRLWSWEKKPAVKNFNCNFTIRYFHFFKKANITSIYLFKISFQGELPVFSLYLEKYVLEKYSFLIAVYILCKLYLEPLFYEGRKI